MSNIQDVDLESIKVLLLTNNIEIPARRSEIYDKAFNLMNKKSTSYENVPVSIIEWMLAYNALKKNDKSYHIRDLRKLSKADQNVLAKSLGMKGNNIENIINILRYMHKLEGELKFEENVDLYNPLLLNSDLSTVISLLKSKPSLRPLVLEILPEIIKRDYDIKKSTSYEEDAAYDFITVLINTKDVDLIKKAINIYNDFIEDFDPYYVLISSFIENKQLNLFFEILPKNYDTNVLQEVIEEVLSDDLTPEEYYHLIHESLKYAIRIKNKELFKDLGYSWTWDLDKKRDLTKEQKEKLNSLFETKL